MKNLLSCAVLLGAVATAANAQPETCNWHDLGRRIDVAVFYTANAASEYPNLNLFLNAINDRFNSSSATFHGANVVSVDSGAGVKFKITGMYQLAWNETPVGSCLQSWWNTFSGLNEVIQRRNIDGADLVIGYVSTPPACGEGCLIVQGLNDFDDCTGTFFYKALTSVSTDFPSCLAPHLGNPTNSALTNLLGCSATPDACGDCGIFPSAAPYCDSVPPIKFHTAGFAPELCFPEIPTANTANLWSSPNLTYQGEPCGDANHNCLAGILATRKFVSRYRNQTVGCTADFNGDDVVNILDDLLVRAEWDEHGSERLLEVYAQWGQPCP